MIICGQKVPFTTHLHTSSFTVHCFSYDAIAVRSNRHSSTYENINPCTKSSLQGVLYFVIAYRFACQMDNKLTDSSLLSGMPMDVPAFERYSVCHGISLLLVATCKICRFMAAGVYKYSSTCRKLSPNTCCWLLYYHDALSSWMHQMHFQFL